mgnify:CR=1 FL=1
MAWIFLLLAGVLEVVWAFLMKASAGFTKPWPTVGMVIFMIASFGLLSLAMKTLPLGQQAAQRLTSQLLPVLSQAQREATTRERRPDLWAAHLAKSHRKA